MSNTTILSPGWALTTDHAQSSYGQPVLVNRATCEAYGSGDLVCLYPNWHWQLATDAVRRLARGSGKLADPLVERFVRKPGAAAARKEKA